MKHNVAIAYTIAWLSIIMAAVVGFLLIQNGSFWQVVVGIPLIGVLLWLLMDMAAEIRWWNL